MSSSTLKRLRRAALFVVALALVGACWELYKAVGPQTGGSVLGWKILPRANDTAMPHVWEMFSRYGDPAQRGSDEQLWRVVLAGVWYSMRLAVVAFVLGVFAGIVLAVVMSRFKLAERAILPYLVLSQTVPLIALAPLVVGWGGKVSVAGVLWPRWLSAAVIGAFLAFFPVAVGTLRGLKSPSSASLELMDSYAAPWHQTLFKLRFPSAVPYMVPALKLAASASVIGVVVAEISTGLKGGVGRLILQFMQQSTSDPEKVFTAVFGAAALGLVMAGAVALIDMALMRNRPKESSA